MTLKRILIAVDGSPGASSATRLGGELALGSEAEVLVVHAVPLPPIVVGGDQAIFDESLDYLERSAAAAVAEAVDVLESMDVKVESIIRPGAAADVILSIAETRDVDAIVVGHRGYGAVRRFIMGSVSSKLAHHARCAVVLAPVPDEPSSEDPVG